jgi:proteasome-associated ATPase
MAADPSQPLRELVEHLEGLAPADSPKLQNAIAALKDEVGKVERKQAEDRQLITEYEEAYNKLTSPANRLGVFLGFIDGGAALISVGEQEFVATVDPAIKPEELTVGTRVRVNDAYAVVGVMPPGETGALSRVADVRQDGRIRLGSDVPNGEGRLVRRADALKGEAIRSGDEVRLDSSGKVAVEWFPRQEAKDYFLEEVKETPWSAIGGQQEAIELIRDTIELPLTHPEIFEQFGKKPIKGILLYGPPGCGKTLIGKATAYNLAQEYSKRMGREVKEYFMAISGPKILNMWLGETERMVREIFATAREKAKEGRLVFIFMDEAESVLRTRSTGRYMNISNTVVPQFCAELDGLASLENVVLILTSNRPDYIDPAVLRPERIDRKVKINRPDRTATTQILGIYLSPDLPIDPELVKRMDGEKDCARKELVEKLTEALWSESKDTEFLRIFKRNGQSETLYQHDLLSGAILKSIVDRAKDTAIRRAIEAAKDKQGVDTIGITLDDLLDAAKREFKENEIFPKSDAVEDWLQLLDVSPESVVNIRPIGVNKADEFIRRNVL